MVPFYNLGPSQKTIKTATLSFPNFFLFLHKPNSLCLSLSLCVLSLPKAHAKKGDLVVWKNVVIVIVVVVVVVDMSLERLIVSNMLQSEGVVSRSHSTKQCCEPVWIFEELPKATIVSVSRPDTGILAPCFFLIPLSFITNRHAPTLSLALYLSWFCLLRKLVSGCYVVLWFLGVKIWSW